MQPDSPGFNRGEPLVGPESCPADSALPLQASPPVPTKPRRPPGPGLWESIAWSLGAYAVQAAALVAAICGLTLLYIVDHPPLGGGGAAFDLQAYVRRMEPVIGGEMAMILGVAGLGVVLYGAAAVSLRLRSQGGLRSLGLHLPSAGHGTLVALAVLPLSLLCTELQKGVTGLLPDAGDEMQQLFARLAAAPLWQVLWGLAIAPAIGEELIFRGLIGRGLISRWGVVRGVLVTSVLFGLVHLHPAQAIAVIPLGAAMHFAYLMTRSFWAPVLLHLLNNSFAAIMLKYGEQLPIARLLDDGQAAPLHLMTVSAAMVTAIGLLLWQTRVQLVSRDGTVCDGSFPGPDAQGGDSHAVPVRQSPRPLLLACGAFNSLGFVAVLWRLAAAM